MEDEVENGTTASEEMEKTAKRHQLAVFVILGPFLPCLFALIIVMAGGIIVRLASTECGYPLHCAFYIYGAIY